MQAAQVQRPTLLFMTPQDVLPFTNAPKKAEDSVIMDPLSVIASTLAIIQAITASYKAIQNIHDLPNEFKEVETYLPLVYDTLKQVEERIKNADLDEASKTAIRPLVSACKAKTEELQTMFAQMEGRKGRAVAIYRGLLIQLGKENRVETLMQGILERLGMIADNQVMRGATHSQMAKLTDAVEALSHVESSVPDADLDRASMNAIQNITENATGNQAVNSGRGPMNNNFGGRNFNSGGGSMQFGMDMWKD
ncbi:ankyrin repeat protein [Ophiostoma piceae UAMH 11346]|uniref:Ankyrin repeat protein n=1 Tax=Ophiostoma piceae (strain UAMH 11346) TaxID=1262450 RepID=S3BZI5_OPHP1|nr:ankyrin repeat protein [Ophiostoma piceae UAMH 11346]